MTVVVVRALPPAASPIWIGVLPLINLVFISYPTLPPIFACTNTKILLLEDLGVIVADNPTSPKVGPVTLAIRANFV